MVGERQNFSALQGADNSEAIDHTIHIEQKLCLRAMNLNCNSSDLNEKLFKKTTLAMSPSGLNLKLSQRVRRVSCDYAISWRYETRRFYVQRKGKSWKCSYICVLFI